MRFTPLGKLLLFLVGLAIVATAVKLYAPKGSLPWPKRTTESERAPRPDDTTSSQVSRQSERQSEAPRPTNDERTTARPASNDPWVRVAGGMFASGPEAASIDVPAFSIQRSEVTNAQYAAFLEACPRGSACGPRGLPTYWEDRAYVEKFPQ